MPRGAQVPLDVPSVPRARLDLELFEDRASLNWIASALDDVMGFSAARSRRPIEPRLARALALMQTRSQDLTAVGAATCAQAVGLSSSRFQHLFKAELGVPFRRYRAWMRMRAAISAIVTGANFTTAAHAAGFADQAHFAHDFRRTFGAPASRSLTGVRRPV